MELKKSFGNDSFFGENVKKQKNLINASAPKKYLLTEAKETIKRDEYKSLDVRPMILNQTEKNSKLVISFDNDTSNTRGKSLADAFKERKGNLIKKFKDRVETKENNESNVLAESMFDSKEKVRKIEEKKMPKNKKSERKRCL